MDWNRTITLGAQVAVVVVLGVLVACGHDSTVTDALLAVSGSIVGIGVIQAVGKKKSE